MPALIKCLLCAMLATLLLPSVRAQATPPIPARIGGSVTVDGTQLTQTTDTGYTFVATKENGSAYVPAAADTDGLNASNCYVIDIPIYDANEQPGGANPGDTAVVHVYKNGSALPVTSPEDGRITVGDAGSITQIDLSVTTSPANIVYVDPGGGCNGNSPCCTTIQQAINAVSVSTVLKVAQGTFSESPTLNRPIQINIRGGWDSTFTSQTPNTTIIKAPIATSGSITLQNLIVRP